MLDRLYNYLVLKYRRATYGKRIRIVGRLVIQGHGAINIGNDVTIYSKWNKNPVGWGCGRTILQTIQKGSISIGDNSGISHAVIVSRNRISIGKNVLIGGGVQIYDNDFHSIDFRDRKDPSCIKSAPVTISDNVFIGANSIILKGVTIGPGAVIGAGSVVTKSIPANQVWGGNPASFIKNV